jgi:hypothetical protein
VHFHQLRHVAQIGAHRDFRTVGTESEADGIDGIVRNRKGVNIDVPDGKALAGVNGLRALQSFPEGVREDTLQRIQGGLGHVQRGFPQTENLRQTVAMIGVFVSDQDGIELFEVFTDGSETRQRFAFAKAGVNEDAGAFGFEQREVARTAGRKNVNA